MSTVKTKQNIPKGWQRVRLGDFGVTLGGLSGKRKENFGHGKPFIPYMNIFRNSHIDKSFIDLVEIGQGEKQNRLQFGDYLFTTSSETPNEVGMSSVVNTDLGEVYLNSFCFIFRPKDKYLDPNFGGYLFRGPLFRKKIASHAKGSTRFNLSKRDFLGVEIIFPGSGQEQKKIADILGAADEEIQKTDEIIAATEKLKRGLMQQLFSRGIGHTKFKKTKVGELPEKWELKKMKDICTVRQGLQIAIENRFKEPGENRYAYITIKYLRNLENPEYIENPSKKVVCSEQDILMTRTGNTGTVITGVSGVFHNNFFLIDFDRDLVDKSFLVYYLGSEKIQRMILERAGTTTIPDLNHGDFYTIPFLMPNKKEQEKIAEILFSVDEKVSVNQKLKAKL